MLRVLEIALRPEQRRIHLVLEMTDPDLFMTSQVPQLPRQLFRLLPRMRRHTCHNDCGKTFHQECRETEIAHLFEHIILELQLQAQQEPTDLLRGETEWDWQIDPKGRYRVWVDYQNELLAFGAIRLAERILLHLDRRDVQGIDIQAEIARLRQVLELSRELSGPVSAPLSLSPKKDIAPVKPPRRRKAKTDVPAVPIS